MTDKEDKKTVQESNSSKAPLPGQQIKHSGHSLLRSKKIWFAFITVFISGAAIGGSCVAFILKPSHHCISTPAPANDMVQKRIIPHMTKTLNLSREQQDKAENIMMKMSTQLREIRKQQAPEIQKIIQSSFANIEKLLNEEQKVKFIEMQKRIKSCRGRGRGRGCPPSLHRRDARSPDHRYPGRGCMISKEKNSDSPK